MRFSDLPAEIRIQIWLASLEPRAVGLVPYEIKTNCWSLKSTVAVPAVLHVNSESRAEVLRHYKLLEFATATDRPALDVAPHILFNFALDTVYFVDRTPADAPLTDFTVPRPRKKPTAVSNALDIIIAKEEGNVFGPGMFRASEAGSRMDEWSYLFQGQSVSHIRSIPPGMEGLGTWTHVRYLRVDFAMFQSELAQYWAATEPFRRWMTSAAGRIEDPNTALRCLELVMGCEKGQKQNLKRMFRLVMRPENPALERGGDRWQRLREDGAVVFSVAPEIEALEARCLLFEVVDEQMSDGAMAKWDRLAVETRQSVFLRITLPRSSLLSRDLLIFWLVASRKRGMARGEIAPVHGLCLPDYGVIDNVFGRGSG